VCCSDSTKSEEGWRLEDVYRLQSDKQNHHQVYISTAENGRSDGFPEWGKLFFKDRSEERISLDSHERG
jgi:hypothetical protein